MPSRESCEMMSRIGLGLFIMRIVLVIALASLCGGCATIIRGTTDQVEFNSMPSGAEVHTSNG